MEQGLNIKGQEEGICWDNEIILYSVCAGCYKKSIYIQVLIDLYSKSDELYNMQILGTKAQ